jgi:hypothetical protein
VLLLLRPLAKTFAITHRVSLVYAFNQNLGEFLQTYKFTVASLTPLLKDFQCRLCATVAGSVQIPTLQQTLMETRRAAQAFLLQLTPERLADVVLKGFENFKPIDGYAAPAEIDNLIQYLISSETDQVLDKQDNLQETATYIIEQALEKIVERSKFTPPGMQAQFVAMLISTFDSSQEGFAECAGPATVTALRRAVEGDRLLVQFLAELATFEFVRSPPQRYQNLLFAIFRALGAQDPRADENPILSFVRGIPYIPETAFAGLVDLCPLYPEQAENMLNAIAEYAVEASATQAQFLRPLLGLSVHASATIQESAIRLVQSNFYKTGEFCERVNQFATEKLAWAVERTDEAEAKPMIRFFFAILELDPFLFLTLLDQFSRAPDGPPKRDLISSLIRSVPKMSFNRDMLGQALNVVTKDNDALIHAYLRGLNATVPVFQMDVAEMIKAQLKKPDPDPRYLIPIIPTLTELEFKLYLPLLLSLAPAGLRIAIRTFLTVTPRPVTPTVFLIELHKYLSTASFFPNVIVAMEACFKYKEIYKYEVSIQAVDVVAREHPLDLIMHTLLVMIDIFKENHRYIIRNVVPILISRGIFHEQEPWALMKELLWKTRPLSIKTTAAQLDADQMTDYVASYPEIKSLMLNHAKANRIQWLVQLLSDETGEEKE